MAKTRSTLAPTRVAAAALLLALAPSVHADGHEQARRLLAPDAPSAPGLALASSGRAQSIDSGAIDGHTLAQWLLARPIAPASAPSPDPDSGTRLASRTRDAHLQARTLLGTGTTMTCGAAGRPGPRGATDARRQSSL